MGTEAVPPLCPVTIGSGAAAVRLDPPVVLAPMSGVSISLPPARPPDGGGDGGLGDDRLLGDERETATRCAWPRWRARAARVAVQLAGCGPDAMAEAARIAVGLGADLIDINFGCPVKKVALGQPAGWR